MEKEARTELVSKITAYLVEKEELVAAYLFGSFAQEKDHRLSDVDVALLLPHDTDQTTAFNTRLQVGAALEQVCQRPVDVVILNHAPPLLRFQVVQRGQVLVEKDHTARCLFQARTMSEYYDTKPYLDYQLSHVIKRIREEGLGAGHQDHCDTLEQARRISKRLATLSTATP
jgi:predicted nucleotidyltransferase